MKTKNMKRTDWVCWMVMMFFTRRSPFVEIGVIIIQKKGTVKPFLFVYFRPKCFARLSHISCRVSPAEKSRLKTAKPLFSKAS